MATLAHLRVLPDPSIPAGGEGTTFADLTTLRAGGPVRRLASVTVRHQLIEAIEAADAASEPLLVLGQGSNLVVGDSGFDGTVIRVATTGQRIARFNGVVHLTAEAGESWASLVDSCVEANLSGIECLAGIPGTVGATPVQNVGAYGQEVASTIEKVEAWDRLERTVVELGGRSLGFAYRTSRFKRSNRWVILAVTFRLGRSPMSSPLGYAQLADKLGIAVGSGAPLKEVRDAVVHLRRAKGMVVDPADPDGRSVGSFFTNPVLDRDGMSRLLRVVRDRLGEGVSVPTFAAEGDRAKIPAAWLIEHAGFRRGFRFGPAGISPKHALALVLYDGRSTGPLIGLARLIRQAVLEKFDVNLEPEPTLVNTGL